MSSIDEDLKQMGEVEDEFQAKIEDSGIGKLAEPVSPISFNFDFLSKLMELLGKPTGEGYIEDYLDHPLNFGKTKGMAQILRGFTGLFGDLKKAVIDIAIGYFNLSKETKVKGDEYGRNI